MVFTLGFAVRDCNAQLLPKTPPLPAVNSTTVIPLADSQATFWFQGINAADTLTVEYRQVIPGTIPMAPAPLPAGTWLAVTMTATNTGYGSYIRYDAHYGDLAGGLPVGTWVEWRVKRAGIIVWPASGQASFPMQR